MFQGGFIFYPEGLYLYGIFTYILLVDFMVNVGTYTIHGSHRIGYHCHGNLRVPPLCHPPPGNSRPY